MKWRIHLTDWSDEMIDALFEFLVEHKIQCQFIIRGLVLTEPRGEEIELIRNNFDRIWMTIHEVTYHVQ